MSAVVWLALLAVTTSATPALAAPEVGQPCTTSAHVSWRPDEDVRHIDEVVVTVPGCDDGEPVSLQVLTTRGDVPDTPLTVPARDGRAVFDVRHYDLGIEPVIGAQVSVYAMPLEAEVLGVRLDADDGVKDGTTAGGDTLADDADGSPLPTTGASVLVLLATAFTMLTAGAIALRRRRT